MKWFKLGEPSKAVPFVTRVLKKGNRYTKSLAHMILEYRSACWDPCIEGQINALNRVQKTAAQFTNHTKDSEWETLAQCRMIACLCALFKAWKALWERLRRPYYLSRVDHVQKIRDRKQKTDIGTYSFINRTTKNWNQLPAEALGTFPCKTKFFRNRVRKAITNGVKRKE